MKLSVSELLKQYSDVHELFTDIDDATRRQLESIAKAETLRDEQEIGTVGSLVHGLYLIVEGTVRVNSLSMDGAQFYVGALTSGELHGLVSVMDEKPCLHFVRVVDSATVLFIPSASFRSLVYTNQKLLARVIDLLCDRVRFLSAVSDRFALTKPLDRVAQCLADISDGYFSTSANPLMEAELDINQYDLSSMLALSRQSVNRSLKDLEAKELITVGYNRIHLNNLPELRRFSGHTKLST
tara:strand:- start:61 stop:780 length:720 start_codon:yes stop_codon:yes gene_type:complete